ncbi:MAG TPA: tetratricopeptide repeat-containing sensor histidine kinase [Flavisolibacter sp.]|jgi:signal transduction histidine kinase|nr:tetratricopeptide repeat-containing sensor histidine kinase [Flavisolibacter sp.]
MYKLFPCFLIIAFLLSGCHQDWASEKEEVAYWNHQVLDSAYKVLYKDTSIDKALSLFDVLKKGTKKQSPFIAAARHTMMANYHYFFTRDTLATALQIDSALSYYPDEKQRSFYPRAYVGLLLFGGEMAFRLADYTKANEYYFKAKQSADHYLDPCERSSFTYNVAMVSYRQQNYKQSASYFQEAYTSQASCPVQTTAIILQQQEIQSNIGLCLVKLQQYDSALIHFNKALEIAHQYKDSLGAVTVDKIMGVVEGNIAKIYIAKGQYTEAESFFRKSIDLNNRPGYEQRDALLVQLQLADLFRLEKRYPEWNDLLAAIRANLDAFPDPEAEASWRKQKYQYYEETGSPLQELSYYKSYISLRDSLSATQKQLIQADITRQLRDKQQELQISTLKRDSLLGQVYLWSGIVVMLMAFLIIYLISHNYRKTKKNVAALTQLNQQVIQQKEALEKANAEKDRILYVVAHDLRNPIGITAYVADLILMEERNEKDRSSLEMIRQASHQALKLTNELLGRPHAPQPVPVKERTELGAQVRSSVQMMQLKAAEKQQKIKLKTTLQKLWTEGYSEKLNRMLGNLLDNAIKFSPVKSVIEVSLEKQEGQALLMIKDHGIGISKYQHAAIFESFTATRRQGTEGETSFGLGLSICKEIVEEHGGTIEIESDEGKGTCFYIRLPLLENA